jgi:hypothetical protein
VKEAVEENDMDSHVVSAHVCAHDFQHGALDVRVRDALIVPSSEGAAKRRQQEEVQDRRLTQRDDTDLDMAIAN